MIGLGPGFTAGVDCHIVIETQRGHHLGRALREGQAEPDSGVPGQVGGAAAERVVRAPTDGLVTWRLGDRRDGQNGGGYRVGCGPRCGRDHRTESLGDY